jgi:hypothetical protein
MNDKAESATYAGRVVDEHGKAVAGATVYALQLSQADEQSHISFGRKSLTMVTDAEGRFAFSRMAVTALVGPMCHTSFDFERALCVVLADTGERCGFGMLTPGMDGAVILHPPVSLRMRVVDTAGTPVAGVRVLLESLTFVDRHYSIFSAGPERWQPVSDADGHVEWSGLPGPCAVVVEVRDEDWAPVQAKQYVSNRVPTPLPEIRALKGASVSGRVLLPDGSPAANFVAGFHNQDCTWRSFDATTERSIGFPTSGSRSQRAIGRKSSLPTFA